MKYIVEIDSSTISGTEALNFLKGLHVSGKSIYIRKLAGKTLLPLSPEEFALPFGRIPSEVELENFLDRKQDKGKPAESVRKQILSRLKRKK